MAKPTTPAAEEAALATVPETPTLALIRELIETVPDVDVDPTPRMAEFILTQPPEKWDDLWAGLPNVKDSAGQIVTVHDIRVRPSDYEGGIGVYLICDITWRSTGEKDLLTCSSHMATLQLLRLYATKRLPATVEIVKKDKATKKGYHPIHLRLVANPNGAIVSEQ